MKIAFVETAIDQEGNLVADDVDGIVSLNGSAHELLTNGASS